MTRRQSVALTALAALLSTASLCPPPKPPTPPGPPEVHHLAVWPPQRPGFLAGCRVVAHRDNAAATLTGTTDTAGYGTATWTVSSVGDDGTTNGVRNLHADVTCPGYRPAHVDALLPLTGDVDVFLGPPALPGAKQPVVAAITLTPSAPPLPPRPTREQRARVRARFQGVMVTTRQLGVVPSWGPELWMLTDAADRTAVLTAHKAAGATHLTVGNGRHSVDDTYSEPGVAYPNHTIGPDAFALGDYATLYDRLCEVIDAGLTPLVMLGGDVTGASGADGLVWIRDHIGEEVQALKHGPRGDITPYLVWCTGFDSIVPIMNAEGPRFPYLQIGLDAITHIRDAIGPDGVQAFEFPMGWSFGGPGALSGPGWYASAAGQAIDTYLQEFDAPPGPPRPPPAILGGVWDEDHHDYAPVWADARLADSFQKIWQIAGRTVLQYVPPPDQPFDVRVRVTGGPLDGTLQPVSADGRGMHSYGAGGTPRGRCFFIAYEYFTYHWVRLQASVADILAARAYLLRLGYDDAG